MRNLDFVALGVTGSDRYRPTPPAEVEERRRRHREVYGPTYRGRNAEKERERCRAYAERRRKERPEESKAAQRRWYKNNRAKILEQKRQAYAASVAAGKGSSKVSR